MPDFSNIIRLEDGTYEITLNGLPYHTYPGYDHWDEVDEYARAHPGEVTIQTPPPEPTLRELKERKRAEMERARAAEVRAGYITLDGAEIETNAETQTALSLKIIEAGGNADFSCEWEGRNGWHTLSLAQIQAAFALVMEFVQVGFDKKKTKYDAIDAAENADDLNTITWEG